MRTGWTWERQFTLLLQTDAILPDLAEFVYDILTLVDSVPPLILPNDSALLELQAQ